MLFYSKTNRDMSFEKKEASDKCNYKDFNDNFKTLDGGFDITKFDKYNDEFDVKFDELSEKYPMFREFMQEFCYNSFRSASLTIDPISMGLEPSWIEKKVFTTFAIGGQPKMETIFIIYDLVFNKELRNKVLNTKLDENDEVLMSMLIKYFEMNYDDFAEKSIDDKKEYLISLVCMMARYPIVVRDLEVKCHMNHNNEKWLGNSLKCLRKLLLSDE